MAGLRSTDLSVPTRRRHIPLKKADRGGHVPSLVSDAEAANGSPMGGLGDARQCDVAAALAQSKALLRQGRPNAAAAAQAAVTSTAGTTWLAGTGRPKR